MEDMKAEADMYKHLLVNDWPRASSLSFFDKRKSILGSCQPFVEFPDLPPFTILLWIHTSQDSCSWFLRVSYYLLLGYRSPRISWSINNITDGLFTPLSFQKFLQNWYFDSLLFCWVNTRFSKSDPIIMISNEHKEKNLRIILAMALFQLSFDMTAISWILGRTNMVSLLNELSD